MATCVVVEVASVIVVEVINLRYEDLMMVVM
jgi:hypothetical protein